MMSNENFSPVEKPNSFLIDGYGSSFETLENCENMLKLIAAVGFDRELPPAAQAALSSLVGHIGDTILFASHSLIGEKTILKRKIEELESLQKQPDVLKEMLDIALKQETEDKRAADCRAEIRQASNKLLEKVDH